MPWPLTSLLPFAQVVVLRLSTSSPDSGYRWCRPVEGVPESRDGHGVPPEVVVAELTAAGFTLEQRDDSWSARKLLPGLCSAGVLNLGRRGTPM